MPEVNANQFNTPMLTRKSNIMRPVLTKQPDEPGRLFSLENIHRVSQYTLSRSATRKAPTEPMWKENPNQMAIPGMEEHAHPGAHLLTQGHMFSATTTNSENVLALHVHDAADVDTSHVLHSPKGYLPTKELYNHTPMEPQFNKREHSRLTWDDRAHNDVGEITGAYTDNVAHQSKGLATTLYGMGRKLGRTMPEHSDERSEAGSRFARASSRVHGGYVPASLIEEEESLQEHQDQYDSDDESQSYAMDSWEPPEGEDYPVPHATRHEAFKAGTKVNRPWEPYESGNKRHA